MKISPVANNYIQKAQRFSIPKISFGEIDGDFYDYSPRRISRAQYEAKKDIINEKYDRMRSSWLNDCDDLGISITATWNRINQIEQLRDRDLAELSREYEV